MLNFKKGLNLKSILFTVFLSFFFTSTLYSCPVSKDLLRVPIGEDKTFKRAEILASNIGVSRRDFLTTLVVTGIMPETALIAGNETEQRLFSEISDFGYKFNKQAFNGQEIFIASDIRKLTDKELVKYFNYLTQKMPFFKTKNRILNISRMNTETTGRWRIINELLSAGLTLPSSHPYHKLMSNFISYIRKLEILNESFSFEDIATIYSNPAFLSETNNFLPANQFSCAKAICLNLNRFNVQVTDDVIEKVLPFVVSLRSRHSERIILDENTIIVYVGMYEDMFRPDPIIALAKRFKSKIISVYRGFEQGADKTMIANIVARKRPGRTLLWINGHGKPGHIILHSGKQLSDERYLWMPKDLADTILSFAAVNNGTAENLSIIMESCFSGDFVVNGLNELSYLMTDKKLYDMEMPSIIAVAMNMEMFNTIALHNNGLYDNEFPLWLRPAKSKEVLSIHDFNQAEEDAKAFMSFVRFMPSTKEDIEHLAGVLNTSKGNRKNGNKGASLNPRLPVMIASDFSSRNFSATSLSISSFNPRSNL